jgi:3-deoxy-D-manno-octulosonate 8-phosphate phosphatase (KDO 8-P phosphatase)
MYVGDDMPDLEPMEKAGIAVAPCDASQDILENSDYITQAAGGKGCVREVIEKVLKTRNQWYGPEALCW